MVEFSALVNLSMFFIFVPRRLHMQHCSCADVIVNGTAQRCFAACRLTQFDPMSEFASGLD